jgi:uncharacterized protein (TIGR03435 family)
MRAFFISLACLASAAALAGQSRPPASFEVASVKASPPMPPGGVNVTSGSVQPGGRWISQNARFVDILRAVYPGFPQRAQIAGGPLWVNTARFDITAIAGRDASREEMRELMKQLLADRFALKVHTEQRPLDVYSLVLARSDGRLGPGLRRVTVDCAAVTAARRRGEAVADGPGRRPQCASDVVEGAGDVQRLTAGGVTLESLVMQVRATMNQIIVDRTGLTGQFDIDFEWSLDPVLRTSADGGDSGPSIFPALERQLGLKLERRKEPVDVLVIDHAEMPRPD